MQLWKWQTWFIKIHFNFIQQQNGYTIWSYRSILILTGAVSLSCIPSCCNLNFNEESVRYPIILSTISGFNNIYMCIYAVYIKNVKLNRNYIFSKVAPTPCILHTYCLYCIVCLCMLYMHNIYFKYVYTQRCVVQYTQSHIKRVNRSNENVQRVR